jgi:hypothetical protein
MEFRPDIASPLVRALVYGSLSGYFWWVFDERYAKYADCIEALANSSCITPDGGNVTSGGILWALLAMPLGLVALVYLAVALVRLRRGRARRN